MEVNGNILEKKGITLLKADIQPSSVTSYLEWIKGVIFPIEVSKEEFRFSNIEIKLLLEATSAHELEFEKSNILSIFRRGTLFFNDFYYDFVMLSSSNRRILDNSCEFTVVLQSWSKYKKEIVLSLPSVLNQKVNIEGNSKTPVIYEIAPKTSIIDLIINDIKIHNVAINKKLIIDGEKCLVTLDGINKFVDVELDDFPTFEPGENSVVINNVNCIIKLRYKPRFI